MSCNCRTAVIIPGHVYLLLENVHAEFLHPAGKENCQLISDDGSENYGPVKDFIKNSSNIEFSNSMIEAANKKLKYNFLYHHHIINHEELVKYVEQSVTDYNNRPHHVLHGLTPIEVLHGQMPTHDRYAVQIQQSKANRLAENKKIKCCYHIF